MSGNPITPQILSEILDGVENSMRTFLSENDTSEQNFLETLYDQYLENFLQDRASGIHFLESGQKLIVINRKRDFLESIYLA